MTAQYTAWLFGLAVGGAMVSFGMELGMLSRPRLRTRCGACGRLVWRMRHAGRLDDPSIISCITLLSVGFYAALRRSELVALDVRDIKFSHAHAGDERVDIATIFI